MYNSCLQLCSEVWVRNVSVHSPLQKLLKHLREVQATRLEDIHSDGIMWLCSSSPAVGKGIKTKRFFEGFKAEPDLIRASAPARDQRRETSLETVGKFGHLFGSEAQPRKCFSS